MVSPLCCLEARVTVDAPAVELANGAEDEAELGAPEERKDSEGEEVPVPEDEGTLLDEEVPVPVEEDPG
jgi:hypothetical protein